MYKSNGNDESSLDSLSLEVDTDFRSSVLSFVLLFSFSCVLMCCGMWNVRVDWACNWDWVQRLFELMSVLSWAFGFD